MKVGQRRPAPPRVGKPWATIRNPVGIDLYFDSLLRILNRYFEVSFLSFPVSRLKALNDRQQNIKEGRFFADQTTFGMVSLYDPAWLGVLSGEI